MTDRKFYRHVFQVEVLSEENLEVSKYSLEQLHSMTDTGEQVAGTLDIIKTEELNGCQAAKALDSLGSEPGFFQLEENGDDIGESDE